MFTYYKCGMQPASVMFHIRPVRVNGVQSTVHAKVSDLNQVFIYSMDNINMFYFDTIQYFLSW